MAAEGKTIVRGEGVSTLKPGGAQQQEQGAGAGRREPQISRTTREDRAAARVAAASHEDEGTGQAADRIESPLAGEQEQLEQREEKLEGDVRKARERGDDRVARNLQSQLDTTRNQLRQVEQERDQWPAWIVQQAQAKRTPEQMIEDIRKEQAKRAASRALTQRSEPDEIIAGLIDSDDPEDLEFARFLRKRVKADIPVTQKNLAFHREEFNERRPAATTTTQNGKPAATTTNGQRKPPKVAGAGGSDLGGEKTGWQPGQSTTELLTRGFAEQDRARRH